MAKEYPLFQIVRTLSSKEEKGVKELILSQKGKMIEDLIKLLGVVVNLENRGKDDVKPNEYNKMFLDAIKKTKVAPSFLNNIAFWKNYLLNIILRYLRNELRNKESAYNKMQDCKENGVILLERGLDKLALKELKKGSKLAQPEEAVYALGFSASTRLLLHEYEQDDKVINEIGIFFETTMKMTQIEFITFNMYEKLYLMQRDKAVLSDEELKQIPKNIFHEVGLSFDYENADLNLKNLALVNGKLSTNAVFYFYYSLALFYRFFNNRNASLLFLSELVTIIDDNLHFKRANHSRYLNLLNNLLNAQFLDEDVNAMVTTITRLEKFVIPNRSLRLKKAQHVHYYKMLFHLRKSEYLAVVNLEKEISFYWDKYIKILPISRQFVFSYNLSISCLIGLEHNKADFWSQKILSSKKKKVRPDIRFQTKLLEIIILYDRSYCANDDDNLFRAKYLMTALLRSLRSKKAGYLDLLSLSKAIQEILNVEISDRRTIMSIVLIRLGQVKAVKENFEEVIYWLENRVSTTSTV